MAIPTVVLLTDGPQPAPYAADSLREAAVMEPRGVYTVARTFNLSQAVLLDAHLDRLEQSARLESHPVALDRLAIRDGLRQILGLLAAESARFRITVPLNPVGPVHLAAEPLPPMPASVKRDGVGAVTFSIRRDNPLAKSNSWEQTRAEAMASMPSSAYEGLLLNGDDRIREGFTSNFFAITGQVLHTAEDGILQGISRRIVLDQLPDAVSVVPQPPALESLPEMTEAFLSSSSRGVVPVVSIDDQPIGGGTPGKITLNMIERYDRWVDAHLEDI